MCYKKILIPLLLSSPLWASSLPSDIKVTVFTTQNYPIQNPELATQIYLLDEVENLEEEATKFLSEDLNTAEQQAQKWLASTEGKRFEQKLRQSYIGITEGWKLGIMKVPAVLFQPSSEEPAVIYGETNLSKAIKMYQDAKE